MNHADRLQQWNHWYEQVPELWRFQLIVWTLLLVGAVNMLLTIAVGFPFALLVGLAIAAIAAVRVPYVLGWVKPEGAGDGASLQIGAPSWVLRVNRWYDGLDDMQRPLVMLAALAIPGAINMWLTAAGGFPFGLLFLIAVLALLAIRAPYTAGWFRDAPDAAGPALAMEPAAPRIGDETAGSSLGQGRSPAPAAAEPAAPREARRPAKPRTGSNDAEPRQNAP